MAKDRLSRKLAVILHADVIGSTTLVQQNESLAHERIQAAFYRFSETIKAYGGTARELRGDALVAEFERASDAVAAALAFQVLNEEFNSTLSDEIQPSLRIGISLGEVVIADNTITGAGVVLAQRLEQLANSGGVVVQGSVSETVPTRMPFDFDNLGEQVIKGFDQPVRAFSVRLKLGGELPVPEAEAIVKIWETNQNLITSKLSLESYEALTGEPLGLPDKPSIAVLPFQNMSGDPKQEYFADGMSEEIITSLSRVPELVVIARNSTFVYKGRAVDIRRVGQELGVRHVLEGSIRKSGDRIRVTAQLVDARNSNHVWAERYDRKLDDIFAVQDEITQKIVIELSVKLVAGEIARQTAVGTNNIEAWECTRRAGILINSPAREDMATARNLIDRALELDDNYSVAWSTLGWLYWEESVWNWSSDPEESMQMAFDAAQKALSKDPSSPQAYSLLGHIYMSRGDMKQAITMSEKSVELAPGDAYGMGLLADLLIESGRLEEGIRKIKKALRLSPYPPAWFLMILGIGYHLSGINGTAILALEQAIEREPEAHLPRLWLACALVEIGRRDEAQKVFKSVLDIEPTISATSWAKKFPSKSHSKLKDNLVACGCPE